MDPKLQAAVLAAIGLLLFAGLEVNAIRDQNLVDELLAGGGIIAQLAAIILGRRASSA